MNDTDASNDSDNEIQPEKDLQTISVLKIYLKDVSFEAPHTPEVYNIQGEPEFEVNLNYGANKLNEDNLHEIVLSITITAKIEDKTMYLAEVQQAGLFELHGFDEELKQAAFGIFCPSQLYPYAREALSNLISKGGFPPLLLDHQNFETIYSQHTDGETQASTQH